MAKLPVVAIVGSPNMGKSTLFNRILKRKIAVVDDRSGVTRDRNYMDTNWNGLHFTLIDTGGMVPESKEEMEQEINNQVAIAVSEADVVVYLVDALNEPSDLDMGIARRFRKDCPEKVIVAANKAETPGAEAMMQTYWSLGLGEPMAVSALHGKGIGDLLDVIVNRVRELATTKKNEKVEYAVQIAVVGRPNAGKSSLINYILGHDRTIVSDMAGTTRDSIDSTVDHNGFPVKLIDTAGLRKKSRVKDDVEYYSNLRSLRSIYRADVCVLLVDTDRELAEQDMKVVKRVKEDKKGLILVWNKWDLIEKDSKTFDKLVKEMRNRYPELKHIPMLSISALTGKRVNDVIDLALKVKESMAFRPSRAEVEDNFFMWTRRHPHPYTVGEKVRFVGIKQQKEAYPHFIVFCTNKHRIEESYINYIRNKLYATYGFEGSFIRLDFKEPGRRRKGFDQSGEGEGFVMEYTVE